MRLGILIFGGVLIGASFAGQLVGLDGWGDVLAWFQGLGVGLLGGVGGSALADYNAPPEEAPAPASTGGKVGGSGRSRAMGHALDASLDPTLESTIAADHQPMRGVVALPGLANTAKQTRQSGAKGYLHIFTGRNKGESLLLTDQPITLGRDPKNALLLKDEGISQVHVELRFEDGKFHIRDLGSKNGTLVNDERVVARRLEGGDVIGLGGETKILFQAL